MHCCDSCTRVSFAILAGTRCPLHKHIRLTQSIFVVVIKQEQVNINMVSVLSAPGPVTFMNVCRVYMCHLRTQNHFDDTSKAAIFSFATFSLRPRHDSVCPMTPDSSSYRQYLFALYFRGRSVFYSICAEWVFYCRPFAFDLAWKRLDKTRAQIKEMKFA